MRTLSKNKKFNDIYGFDPFAAIPWKKPLFYFLSGICIIIVILTWNNYLHQKRDNFQPVRTGVEQRRAHYNLLEEIETYRNQAETRIEANHRTTTTLASGTGRQTIGTRENYIGQVIRMENQNKVLTNTMAKYRADTSRNWKIFKTGFESDMVKLEAALQAFTLNHIH